jgi:hypothetical protein
MAKKRKMPSNMTNMMEESKDEAVARFGPAKPKMRKQRRAKRGTHLSSIYQGGDRFKNV